ncbi:hypothetical protein Tco_1035817 [Tanacetum coccineum]
MGSGARRLPGLITVCESKMPLFDVRRTFMDGYIEGDSPGIHHYVEMEWAAYITGVTKRDLLPNFTKVQAASSKRKLVWHSGSWQDEQECNGSEFQFPLHSSSPGGSTSAMKSFKLGEAVCTFSEVGEQICKFGKPQGAYLHFSLKGSLLSDDDDDDDDRCLKKPSSTGGLFWVGITG